MILEANYSPDASRILQVRALASCHSVPGKPLRTFDHGALTSGCVQYHPSFYDEVFPCLFLDGASAESTERDGLLLPLGDCL